MTWVGIEGSRNPTLRKLSPWIACAVAKAIGKNNWTEEIKERTCVCFCPLPAAVVWIMAIKHQHIQDEYLLLLFFRVRVRFTKYSLRCFWWAMYHRTWWPVGLAIFDLFFVFGFFVVRPWEFPRQPSRCCLSQGVVPLKFLKGLIYR